MATVDKVTMSIGRTVNIGNYESVRMEISAESRVPEGGDPIKTLNDLETGLTSDLDRRIQGQVKVLRG